MTDTGVTGRTHTMIPARRRAGRALTLAVALAVALVDWVVCTAILRMDLIVDQGAGPTVVQPTLVAAAPIVSGLAGWGLLAILERISARVGTRIWTIIATIVCVLSCYSPITAALSAPTGVALLSMHLLVGATLILGLRRR